MQDRVSLYPGRVKLEPVAGQANTYDLTRADQSTQDGTPINKASLLKDTTAALYGKTEEAVPDDMLIVLSKSVLAKVSEKYTRHVGTNADRPVGSTMTLNVGGKPYEFIVVQQGKPSSMYDDSCNGTWLLMKDIYENRQWHSSDVNKLESSTIHSYLNSTFLNLFDSNIRDVSKQVKLPYRKNGGSGGTDQSGANGLSAKVFLLSGYEVGWTTSDNGYFPVDGAKLDYFTASSGGNSKRIANLGGSAAYWWIRSPYTGSTDFVWYVNSDGSHNNLRASGLGGIRPCIILSSDAEYIYYTDEAGNVYSEQEVETQLTDVLGNLIQIPASQIKDGAKIETSSYTGTGTYGSANPVTLTFPQKPALIFVIGDEGGFLILTPRSRYAVAYMAGSNIAQTVTWSGNSVSWWSNSGSAINQLNASNNVYQVFAFLKTNKEVSNANS